LCILPIREDVEACEDVEPLVLPEPPDEVVVVSWEERILKLLSLLKKNLKNIF
jgi:hypothetical protein